MRDLLLDTERKDLEELFQNLSNKYGLVITVCWSNSFHEAFTPQKEDSSQLVFEEMKAPLFKTQREEPGE